MLALHNPIKTLLLSFLGLVFFSCSSTKSTVQTSDSTEDQSLEQMAKALVEALNANDLTPLDAFLPDADMARAIAPNETKGLSDSEIENVLIADLKNKLLGDFANIRKGLNSPKDQITMTGIDVEESDTNFPSVVSIKVESPGKKGSIPVTFQELDGQFCIFEILLSSNTLK